MDKLKTAGFKKVRSVSGEVPGKGTYYRVRVGSYLDDASAESDRRRMKRELKLDCLVMVCE